jgi:hypothetical protein
MEQRTNVRLGLETVGAEALMSKNDLDPRIGRERPTNQRSSMRFVSF